MDAALPLQEFTRHLLAAIEPTLEELRYAVALHPSFSVLSPRYLDDDLNGATVSRIGLACERTDGEIPEITLAISCLLLRLSETDDATLQCMVVWSRGAAYGGSDGFLIYESKPPSIRVGDLSDLSRASQYFPELKAAYLRSLRRGTLPSRRQQLWNKLFRGCPDPFHYSLNGQ